jgi:hypothetical protein
MNGWRARLLLCLLLWLSMQLHAVAVAGVPNTPQGMLAFHGSAAALDVVLTCSAHFLVSGRLCDDMENLCLFSAVGNALGWALYLASTSPVFYNTFMWGLSYVQWGRLLYVDRNDADADHSGVDLVRLADRIRGHLYFGKAIT